MYCSVCVNWTYECTHTCATQPKSESERRRKKKRRRKGLKELVCVWKQRWKEETLFKAKSEEKKKSPFFAHMCVYEYLVNWGSYFSRREPTF